MFGFVGSGFNANKTGKVDGQALICLPEGVP